MKYDNLISMAAEFLCQASRKKGKRLNEVGSVVIYRSVPLHVTTFGNMDYITLSRKFAEGHADHGAVVDEEPHHVLMATVKASDVYEAYNPGEYFYDGPAIKGKEIYISKHIDVE